ncbi:MAG TPA: hypothetical protein VIK74_07685 [Parasegetibacter sp.]
MKKEEKGKQANADNNPDELLNYPPEEDITRNSERADINLEEMNKLNTNGAPSMATEDKASGDDGDEDLDENDELKMVEGTGADVTEDDITLLGPKDRDMDMGEDEELESLRAGLNPEESDLDVPGAELDDNNEEIGEEDEENNYYSLGGDQHD